MFLRHVYLVDKFFKSEYDEVIKRIELVIGKNAISHPSLVAFLVFVYTVWISVLVCEENRLRSL